MTEEQAEKEAAEQVRKEALRQAAQEQAKREADEKESQDQLRREALRRAAQEQAKREVELAQEQKETSFKESVEKIISVERPKPQRRKSEIVREVTKKKDDAKEKLDVIETLAVKRGTLKSYVCCFLKIDFDFVDSEPSHQQSANTALVVLFMTQVAFFFLYGFCVEQNYIEDFFTVYQMVRK